MSSLTALPGLPPDAIEQLAACGIESAEMLAAIPAVEIHRVLELTAWQRGKLNRAPTLDMVHHWARLAHELTGGVSVDDIPEAIVVPRRPALPQGGGYVPPSQRARLQAAGPPTPAAPPTPLPDGIRSAVVLTPPASLPASQVHGALPVALPGPAAPVSPLFSTFEDYQAGKARVAPLSRYSIDAPLEERAAIVIDRPVNPDNLPRTMRRGVVYPNAPLLVFGAIVSLIWRAALLAAITAVPWLILTVPRPSIYKLEILWSISILTALGLTQLILIGRIRCRICTCHLLHSRKTVKNRKAHLIPGFGYTASLALHLLLFQWFRCMYCGTAIKLWSTKAERGAHDGAG